MNNEEKARVYDDCVRQGDVLQRENSKLKSQYVMNMPDSVKKTIDENNEKIEGLVKRLNSLFN